jgi:hypothetical protein
LPEQLTVALAEAGHYARTRLPPLHRSGALKGTFLASHALKGTFVASHERNVPFSSRGPLRKLR